MFFVGRRRPGSFALRMAMRAILTAAAAIVAAVVIESTAMPRLQGELKGLHRQPPASLKWLGAFQGRLKYVPVPALVLGIAAMALPRARSALAVLATVASVAALVIVVGSLLALLAPMYEVPEELGLRQ